MPVSPDALDVVLGLVLQPGRWIQQVRDVHLHQLLHCGHRDTVQVRLTTQQAEFNLEVYYSASQNLRYMFNYFVAQV